MTFLVDAHLPPGLCTLLRQSGHTAIHTSELPAGNDTPDEEINRLSVTGQWIVISKDTDFYYSHLLHAKPWKLVLVRTGNIGTGELKALFLRCLPSILESLASSSLIELDRARISIHS